MMIVVKDKVETWIDKREKQIEASEDKKAIVDIGMSFERFICKIIVHICFGEDISQTLIEIDIASDPKGSKYERKKLCLPEAMRIVIEQLIKSGFAKCFIDFLKAFRDITGMTHITKSEKIILQNCLRIRAVINDYVQKRKSGERKSLVAEGADLLSLFLSDREIFTDEVIVDEILDFFSAGTLTTGFATQTLVINVARRPDILKRMRDEFLAYTAKNLASSDSTMSKRDILNRILDLKATQDLEYLNLVIQESLRIQSPTPSSSGFCFSRDKKVGDIKIRKGDPFLIDFYALHYDQA